MTVAVTAGVAELVDGSLFGCGTPAEPAPRASAAAETAPLPWLSAMVARDDTTITVYAGVAGCRDLTAPQATATEQDASRVTVAVSAGVVAAVDCGTANRAVPVAVSLSAPLGDRTLSDAATDQPRPTYFERHLPDLRSHDRWSPAGSSWPADSESWFLSHNGPDGLGLVLRADPTEAALSGDPVDTVQLGPYHGTIIELATWWVFWEIGDVTYGLRVIPSEGDSMTLNEFKAELARLAWS